jgi:hypothetical protein
MKPFARKIRAGALSALIAAGAASVVGQPPLAEAQATVDLSGVNGISTLSQADQTALDNALQGIANAIASGNQAQIDAANAQLATAIQTAVADDPNAAAQIAGAATAAVPSAALTIAQYASAGNPGAAVQIAIAVYTNLPPNLQDAGNKTLIASAVATGSGSDLGVVTAALGPLNVVALANSVLPPEPPPPPPPLSGK